jgi:hypothetical protein
MKKNQWYFSYKNEISNTLKKKPCISTNGAVY